MRTIPGSAYLLFLSVLGAFPTLAQQAASQADAGNPPVQSPPAAPDRDGNYHRGPGVESPYITSPAMATLPDSPDRHGPRIVRFTAVIAADGSVTKLAALGPDDDALEAAATTAIQQSKFAPGTVNGNPVPVAVCLRVPFIHVQPAIPRLAPCPQDGFAASNPAFRLPPGVSPPRAINTVDPEYSDQARRQHIEGIVLVSTLVDEQGAPTDIRVERGVGYGLDENAVRAVSQYRFRPAADRDGRPVAVRVAIEISYRLDH